MNKTKTYTIETKNGVAEFITQKTSLRYIIDNLKAIKKIMEG